MTKMYNGENFDEIIKNRVLVDFYADWCGPGRRRRTAVWKYAYEVSGVGTALLFCGYCSAEG